MNQLTVSQNSLSHKGFLYYYDITISPEVTSKKVCREVINKLVHCYKTSHLGNCLLAYDGRKCAYAAGPLPFASKDFVVKLDNEGTRRDKEFKVSIKFASKADLHHLQQFLNGSQHDAPQETIQFLDVVLRETPSNIYETVGRSFFSLMLGRQGELGNSLQFWKGFYPCLMPTHMGLSLNIDMAARTFFEPTLVSDYIQKYPCKDVTRFLSDQDPVKLKRTLRCLRVELNQLKYVKRCKVVPPPTLQSHASRQEFRIEPFVVGQWNKINKDLEILEMRVEGLEKRMKRSNDKHLKREHELCLRVKALLWEKLSDIIILVKRLADMSPCKAVKGGFASCTSIYGVIRQVEVDGEMIEEVILATDSQVNHSDGTKDDHYVKIEKVVASGLYLGFSGLVPDHEALLTSLIQYNTSVTGQSTSVHHCVTFIKQKIAELFLDDCDLLLAGKGSAPEPLRLVRIWKDGQGVHHSYKLRYERVGSGSDHMAEPADADLEGDYCYEFVLRMVGTASIIDNSSGGTLRLVAIRQGTVMKVVKFWRNGAWARPYVVDFQPIEDEECFSIF